MPFSSKRRAWTTTIILGIVSLLAIAAGAMAIVSARETRSDIRVKLCVEDAKTRNAVRALLIDAEAQLRRDTHVTREQRQTGIAFYRRHLAQIAALDTGDCRRIVHAAGP